MNKLTKGAIAGGAGIVLLMGGAGTFALWNDSASVDGGTIASGTLGLESAGAGVWEDVSPDAVAPGVINPASFLTVPGDTLTYTQSFTIDATGDNLVAEFDYSYAEGTLPTGFATDVEVSVNGGAPVSGAVVVEDGDDVEVVLTLEFDEATAGQVSQDETVDLAAIGLTVTQVRP
jgi:alternate signal-mediated exported protein